MCKSLFYLFSWLFLGHSASEEAFVPLMDVLVPLMEALMTRDARILLGGASVPLGKKKVSSYPAATWLLEKPWLG